MRRETGDDGGRGSALIITLAFLGLVSLLVIGFVTRSGIEVVSARVHLQGIQASFFAEAGSDMALARIRAALTTNVNGTLTNPAYFWVTQPGRITLVSAANPAPGTVIDLSSGAAGGAPDSTVAVDLNLPSIETAGKNLIDSDPALTKVARRMFANWIYIRQDGSVDTNLPPATPAKDPNPVVGRYAFWVDDESAKINLNTAWTRSAAHSDDPSSPAVGAASPFVTNSLSDPSYVNLAVLGAATNDINAIHQAAGATPANSLDEIGRINPGTLPGLVVTQNFSLTHYNHSTDLNMFNEPRIVLTTRAANLPPGLVASPTNYFNILANPANDPGLIDNLSPAGVATVVNYLNKQLMRTDWPFMPGPSFLSKYGNDINAVTLISMNIVDYVRGVESTNQCVEPLVGNVVGGKFVLNEAGNLIADSRRPYLNEIGAYVTNNGTSNEVHTYTEFSAPAFFGPPAATFTNLAIPMGNFYLCESVNGTLYTNTVTPFVINQHATPGLLVAGNTVLLKHVIPAFSAGARPATLTMQVSLLNAAKTHTLARSPVLAYPVDPATIPEAVNATTAAIYGITGYGVNDMQVGQLTNNGEWSYVATSNSFNAANFGTSTHGGPVNAAIVPQQDTTSAGKIAMGGYLPTPKGELSANPQGLVLSVAELGVVTTGADYAGAPITPPSGVWRTVHLGPQSRNNVLPDWALLDLFAVPVLSAAANAASAPFVRPPNQNSWGGKINLNAQIFPFTAFSRSTPLGALLSGANTYGGASGGTVIATNSPVIANILNFSSTNAAVRAASFAAGGGTNYGYPFFLSPGEIAEVSGVVGNNESCEPLLRELVGLATVRGDVFSIYSVGQSLREDPQGGIHVLGERRFQTLVERVEPSPAAVANGAPAGIQILPVSFRELQ